MHSLSSRTTHYRWAEIVWLLPPQLAFHLISGSVFVNSYVLTLAPPGRSAAYQCVSGVKVPIIFPPQPDQLEHRLSPLLNEEVLCSSSRYFTAALREHWSESASGFIDLPEANAEAFSVYTQWLYTGALHLICNPAKAEEVPKDLDKAPALIKTPEQRRWVDCYALADYLQDPDFKDTTLIDAVAPLYMRVTELWPAFGLFPANVYKWSTVGSSHRAFVTDTFVAGWCKKGAVDELIESVDEASEYAGMVPDILRSYSKAVIDEEDPVCPWELEDEVMCVYREHGTEGGECYSEKRGPVQVL